MVLGVLQFHVLVHGAESLKDKRRVVQSLKDRLHREHLCSIAEVGDPDMLNAATMALAVVTRDGQRAGEILDAITIKLRELRDGEVGEIDRQVLHASAGWLGMPQVDEEPLTDARPAEKRISDPKSGDGSDAETDALIHEHAMDSDLLSQIEEAEREDRLRRGGDAA
ncbi:MAG: DUF503 domain-containing protein [Phycisphaeraceae bacterium]|nr:DUF503 domain-containing protein [Phycisphaeraceae bacterium]